jgi:salicylate hydroxylase
MAIGDGLMIDQLPIIIAGAGIGGLAAALALSQRGRPCRIIERRSNPSEEGAGIQIGPNGVKVLRMLGVADDLTPVVGVPAAIRVHDGRSGADLASLPLGAWIENRHGAPYWVALRADLHGAMYRAAHRTQTVTIDTGTSVSAVTSTDCGVQVITTDGRVLDGAALIAADGMWSAIRAQHFDGTPPCQIGLTAARAVISAAMYPDPWARSEIGVWLAPGVHFVHYPVRGGAEIAMILIFRDNAGGDSWSSPMSRDAVKGLNLQLHGSISDVIGAVPAWTRWPLLTRTSLPQWTKGHIALLGDAAHPVLPFLAQGAVMALEDAAALAACLGNPKRQVADALLDYQSTRISRCARVSRAAARNGKIYHLRRPVAVARNAVLRVLPGTRVMAGYDWLYGYERPEPFDVVDAHSPLSRDAKP